jgi:hypothetical protein
MSRHKTDSCSPTGCWTAHNSRCNRFIHFIGPLVLILLAPGALLHAAIKAGAPQNAPAAAAPATALSLPDSPTVPTIEDIAPPIDVAAYPRWMVVSAICVAALLLMILIRLAISRLKRNPPPPPEPPRQIALRALENLAGQLAAISPYELSIAVSDVVRSYVEADTGLQAVRQTSMEFLGSISTRFSTEDSALLSDFLEKCDLIKFARLEATAEDSRRLLGSARSFVEGRQP